MRKSVVAFVAAMLLGGASANELPFQGEFILTVGGVVVGTGELDEGELEINLADGTIGFDGVLVVLGEDGLLVEYDVSVGPDGSVLMWESLMNLNQAVIDAGGEVEVEYDFEHADVDNAEENLDEAAEDAAEQAAEAAEDAAEAAEDAAEQAAEAAEDAAEDAEDEESEDEESEDEDEESEE